MMITVTVSRGVSSTTQSRGIKTSTLEEKDLMERERVVKKWTNLDEY